MRSLIVALCLACAALPAQGQALEVVLDAARPVRVELAPLERRTVRAADHGAAPAEWGGVSLADVLARVAGVPMGERLRGPALATYVVVEAEDGYRAVFSLAELDPAIGGRAVLLADARDGRPLPAGSGPLRLVVPDDRRHGRWVRQVARVRVRRG